MTRVVVTGSAGFIGSHLVDALLERGDTVIGVDDLSMGRSENFAHLRLHPRFSFHPLDVRDLSLLREAAHGAEVIVHLAAYKIPRYGGALDTLIINGIGTRHALEAAREEGCKFVLASTSDVYGKNPELPFQEAGNSVLGSSRVPRWSYAVSKLYGEHLAFAYQERYRLPVVILRFFGSYGPRQHRSWWGGPQAVFIESILKDEPIEIHGDGQQTRSFTYVADTVRGVLAAIDSDRAVGQVLNIGSTREIAILDLARLIHRLIKSEGEPAIRYVPYADFGRYEDVRRRVPDVALARELLGFEARTPLEEGLPPTIEWQRAHALASERLLKR